MNNLWLTVPVGTRRQYIDNLVRASKIPKKQIVIVNTVEGEEVKGVNNLYDLGEINIHRWWNKGIDYAVERGAKYVAVLNDDLELSDDPLNKIAKAMSKTKSKIGTPYPFTGNIPGYCWVLDVKSGIRPDEKFRWWFGDNDLFLQAKGSVITVLCKVRHIEPNWQTSADKDLMELTKADAEYFYDKWKV